MKSMQHCFSELLSVYHPKTDRQEPYRYTSFFPQNTPSNQQKKTVCHTRHKSHSWQLSAHLHSSRQHPLGSAAHKKISKGED